MTKPLPDCLRRLALLALFSVVSLVAACGPGTGGTGTGPIGLSFGGKAGANQVPGQGATCGAGCDGVALELDGDRVRLAAACLRFVRDGVWATDAEGVAVLAGTLEAGAAGEPGGPAELRLRFSQAAPEASAQVTATLTGPGGELLAGPLVLLRDDAAAAQAPDCPGP